MCTHFYLQYQSQELKDIMQEAVIMPEEKINEWIYPNSKPEDILPYALTDLIMKKTTENEEKDEPKGFVFLDNYEYSFIYVPPLTSGACLFDFSRRSGAAMVMTSTVTQSSFGDLFKQHHYQHSHRCCFCN